MRQKVGQGTVLCPIFTVVICDYAFCLGQRTVPCPTLRSMLSLGENDAIARGMCSKMKNAIDQYP